MKVAYLVNQYPKTSHSFIRREIAALERLGVQVERFTIRRVSEGLPDGRDQAEAAITNVLLDGPKVLSESMSTVAASPAAVAAALRETTTLARAASTNRSKYLAYLAEAATLCSMLKDTGITHVHAHFGTNSATVALLWSILSGGTYSMTVHGPEEFDSPAALSLGRKVSASAFTVAISDFCRSQLCRWTPYEDWGKIVKVRCAVDSTYLASPPPAMPSSRRFLFVGRLSEQKAPMLLLEAAIEALKVRSFELVFIGDGDFRSMMERRIAGAGVSSSIKMHGWGSGDEVRRELERSQVLVLPSFAEGLPVVIMESLATGRPVITTTVAGIPELVRTGENGWLVPPGNTDALVSALVSAADTPVETLAAMGRAGREAVEQNHNDEREAAALRSHIARVLDGR